MRVCAEKNCGADISNRYGNAKRCLQCAKKRYGECERAYFKSPKGKANKGRGTSSIRRERRALRKEYRRAYQASPKGKAARKRYEQSPRRRALRKEYVRAYQASAKGKAAMKRYRQSAKGQAASRAARKKYIESPKGRATLQALRERNKEHQKAYRESPRAGHGLRSRMGE